MYLNLKNQIKCDFENFCSFLLVLFRKKKQELSLNEILGFLINFFKLKTKSLLK